MQMKLGRKEEGYSSNRPKLKAYDYWCDNQVLLKALKRWIGEGGKATSRRRTRRRHFVGGNQRVPKKDDSSEHRRFWSQVKAHRGELAKEEADIQADTAISGMPPLDKSSSFHIAIKFDGSAGCRGQFDEDKQKMRWGAQGIVWSLAHLILEKEQPVSMQIK